MDKKNNQNDNPNKKKNIKSAIILLVVCLGITALFTSVMSRYKNGSQKKISSLPLFFWSFVLELPLSLLL